MVYVLVITTNCVDPWSYTCAQPCVVVEAVRGKEGRIVRCAVADEKLMVSVSVSVSARKGETIADRMHH